eukprot:m.101361 g.101361  ORF g.101361 m.101361 type:complete len:57 (-) comp13742_c0_seq1:105-275(-)
MGQHKRPTFYPCQATKVVLIAKELMHAGVVLTLESPYVLNVLVMLINCHCSIEKQR